MTTRNPSSPTPRRRDRPRKEEVTVSLDPKTLDAVDARASELALSRSAVLRMAIVAEFNR